ncbi:hypothetical protein [Streptomyces abyssomicinicus]|uniref:hypothetical protein n=1 Tax=Streptomyces abyssomicinicus TaxID=574929 RepID=UPI0012504B0D|nr:hypothetical protein [Streptomyces abyssomicinicus]
MTAQELVARMLPPFAGWLAVGALTLPDGSPARVAAVVVFLAAGPGAALVRIWWPALAVRPLEGPAGAGDPRFGRRSALLERLMLVPLVSVAAVTVTATTLLAAQAFSGRRVLLLLTLLTMLAAYCPRTRPS